ncbi:MAG: galactokinase [Deinococcus sp.]|nr:galactokinase [Deinococcus sp.]MCL5964264.1 galactokinase [Deinococcus sp.]
MGFIEVFGHQPATDASAPGRVNLLGEHTDYNQGFVLPTPLSYNTRVEASAMDGIIEAYAENFSQRKVRGLQNAKQGDWLDYPAGCVWVLRQAGYQVPGARMHLKSSVPIGVGLSSSAALEVATLRALRRLFGLDFDDVTLARLAQRAEVEYVGVRCGIMDQMVASLGQPGHALFLDTRDLSYRLVTLPRGYAILVVDSGIPRRLAESGYNTRRTECEEACKLLGVKALRDVPLQSMRAVNGLPEPLNRRARHVVTENARVLEGVEALEQGNVKRFGELMLASHQSLKEDYRVSLPEVDQLVEICIKHGAVGARITGAGFGGAIVALVPEGEKELFCQGVTKDYPAAKFF